MEDRKKEWELLINSMKYLAEHSELDFDAMTHDLNTLGWNMSIQDVATKIPRKEYVRDLAEGIRYGDYFTGANILANVITRPQNYDFVKDKLMRIDNGFSVYEYIRVVTHDRSYTKDNIEVSKRNK